MSGGEIYVATEAASTTCRGVEMALIPGQTTVRAGHPVLAQHPGWFKILEPSYEWDAEGEAGAPRSAVRADQRAARTR
jgi:hypothetical protein